MYLLCNLVQWINHLSNRPNGIMVRPIYQNGTMVRPILPFGLMARPIPQFGLMGIPLDRTNVRYWAREIEDYQIITISDFIEDDRLFSISEF
jgi:hypothetical protein